MKLAFSEDIEYIQVKEDGYVLHLDTGRIELLNPVGTLIFDLLGKGVVPENLAEEVLRCFESEDPESVRRDVEAFMDEMKEKGILLKRG